MGLTPLNLHYWQADRESGEDKEDWEVHNKQTISDGVICYKEN